MVAGRNASSDYIVSKVSAETESVTGTPRLVVKSHEADILQHFVVVVVVVLNKESLSTYFK